VWLLAINSGLIVLLVVAARGRMAYREPPSRLTWTAVLPIAIVALGIWRFFPSSEYVIGGKDPGVYINEGVQIAQRGTLAIHDATVVAVPDYARDLFFPSHFTQEYYGIRFMGFYLRDVKDGEVTGQFPQGFPASIALAYGVHGLTGARVAIGLWALIGLLAVYFAGARFAGWPAAFAAAILLELNVATVWFSRYPNSELMLQALSFGSLLAFARAQHEDDRFFGPVAAVLAGLGLFVRAEAIFLVGGLFGAAILTWLVTARRSDGVPRRAWPSGFVLWLLPSLALAALYYTHQLSPYFARFAGHVKNLPGLGVTAALGALFIVFAALLWIRRRSSGQALWVVPRVMAAGLVLLALYAAFFREPGGRLAESDAHALRTFIRVYLLWPGFAAALAGIVVVLWRHFWRDAALVIVFAGFSVFFFYKIHVVPTEFWAARRFLPIILPAILLFAAAAGLGMAGGRQWLRRAAGVIVVGVLGWQYAVNAAPVMPHVEYAGIIPALERLASRFGDRDLLLVESRDAGSDTHTLALPLAYIYARKVLVLNSPRPDKVQLRLFLENALATYAHVYFVGGGGTDLLSRRIGARSIADERLKLPEFESTDQTLPREVRRKDFDYSVYELTLDAAAAGGFALDIGDRDDLHVVRFHAKEVSDERTIRWTGPQSFIAISGMTGAEREVNLVLSAGGRPVQAPAAHVEVYLDGAPLGGADVSAGFQGYRFAIPSAVAANAGSAEDPAQLTLVSTVWTPQQWLGGADDRRLGVMVDRIELR
jgi:hypothetical protein